MTTFCYYWLSNLPILCDNLTPERHFHTSHQAGLNPVFSLTFGFAAYPLAIPANPFLVKIRTWFLQFP